MSGSDEDARAATIAVGAADDTGRTRAESVDSIPTGPAAPVAMPAAIGRYQLVARLGAGAMGVVWSANDPQLDRKVAIKVVHPRLASAPEASLRMLREARAMAKLSHRAVVTVFDAGEAEGLLFLAMELIDGETLTARLARPDVARPEAWRARLALVLEAGRGLAAAHAAGVLHRDFKPDNVLVDQRGRVCVGDFGLATLGELPRERAASARDGADDDLMLTTTGALLGTPMYMAPQQLRGKLADARADQFAFCVTAYEALYGLRPFAVASHGLDALPALIAAVEAGVLAAPADATLVPVAVRDVLRRGLAADPAARWPDMDALLLALETASGLRARRRRRAALAIGGLVAVVIVATAGAWLHSKARPQPVQLTSLYRVSAEGQIVVGPQGDTVVIGGARILVYEQDSETPWTLDLGGDHNRTWTIEADRDEVRYSTNEGGTKRIWKFRDGSGSAPVGPYMSRMWSGSLAGGDLYVDGRGIEIRSLIYVREGRDVWTRPLDSADAALMSTSPDTQHLAYYDSTRERLVVLSASGTVVASDPIKSVTALTWSTNDELFYAINTSVQPTLLSVHFADGAGFGTPDALWHRSTGWFMRLAAGGGRTLVVDASPLSRARTFAIDSGSHAGNRDYEPARAAAELGWTEAGELLTWNRTTHALQRGLDDRLAETPVRFDREPANATRAGTTLIVTTRAESSRDVIAFDLTTGRELWRHTGDLFAVRCAEDRDAPCVAIDARARDIVDIDPATGALGATRARVPRVEDVAVRANGDLLLVGGSPDVTELSPSGAGVGVYRTPLATLRSIAGDGPDACVVAGTLRANTYAAGRVAHGDYTAIAASDAELLMLARPSPDHAALAALGRTYATEVTELVWP